MPRKPRFTALLLALVLIAAACGGSSKNSGGAASATPTTDNSKPVVGGSVVYAQEAEKANGLCLPEAELDISGINYARTIYDTLTAPNENGKFVPFLAKTVTPNTDFTVWTIVLRDGITFHDGSALDATVVKNNLDAYRGKYPGRSPLLFAIVFRLITAVDVVDAMTVKVTMSATWPAFDSFLWSTARLGIMAQKQLDEGAECAKDLIGTGPFKLQDWVINDHFTAVKNPNYWQKDKDGVQLPYLDSITFKPIPDGQQRLNGLQSGQFQMIHTSSSIDQEQLRALAKQGTITENESDKFAEVSHLMLCSAVDPNDPKVCPGSPFNNIHARKAVALAFDRETYNHVRAKDIPKVASGPFAPGAIGFLEDAGFPKFNLDEAKKEVAAYTAETGKPLEFTYGGTTDPESIESQNFTKGMLEAAGMKVSTYTVEQTQYISVAIARNYQMYDWRNYPGSDPDSLFVWWHCSNSAATPAPCDNPVNFGAFNDPTISTDQEKGRAETNAATRAGYYEDLNRQFSKQLYNVWRNWTVWAVPTSPKVHGIVGPDLPDGGKPFPGFAAGLPVSGIYVTP
ncbi:MAG: peptide/nickel transport system substrate-binding protein [Acidimicrobiaceae bacterium]|jgi:peptide/nickel transport system substrate-binding protein